MLPIRTILHPTDFSVYSAAAFELACALARDYGARLVVLHVKPPVEAVFGELGPLPPEPPEARQALYDELRTVRPADARLPVEHRLREGGVVEGILEEASASGCDLIVLGTHGRTGLGRLLLGSVAEPVLRRAPCPVLTVKHPLPATMTVPAEPALAGVTG
jgi:nucleotide-binding universal stress UspA family protein